MDTIEPRKQTRECSNLSGQHSSIGRSLITISLHFHATGHPEAQKCRDLENQLRCSCSVDKKKEHNNAHLQMVSLPERSVMWTKVSLKEAKMCATPNTSSPSLTLNDQGLGRGHGGFRLITHFVQHTYLRSKAHLNLLLSFPLSLPRCHILARILQFTEIHKY